MYLTLLGVGHEPVALNSVTICLWGTRKEKITAMSKFLSCETVQELASPQVTQVSGPRISVMLRVRGPGWKIPCIYRQPLDTVVMSFEERLGREDVLPIQPLMLAPGVGASRAPGLARTRQLGVLRGTGGQAACSPGSPARAASTLGCQPRPAAQAGKRQLGWSGDAREGKRFAMKVEVSRVCRE